MNVNVILTSDRKDNIMDDLLPLLLIKGHLHLAFKLYDEEEINTAIERIREMKEEIERISI